MEHWANFDTVVLQIHAMPCTNRCRHCWAQGSPRKPRMPLERIFFILAKLAELKECFARVGFFLLDEPTSHPHFIEIIERASELGLVADDFFIATNGSILARAPDEIWARLKGTGVGWLQFTVYGLEEAHDNFARRRGAFRGVITAIERSIEHGIDRDIGVLFHSHNAHELAETVEYARSPDPSGKSRVGLFTFLWQGRGRSGPRPTAKDYALLPDDLKRTSWVEEREAVLRILESPELSARRADEGLCQAALTLDLYHDLMVFAGGACDSGGIAGAVPELHEEFAIGQLGEEGFVPLLESYDRDPSRVMRWLGEVSWGELAARYGSRTNDEIYWLPDLPLSKWSAAHLLERVRRDPV